MLLARSVLTIQCGLLLLPCAAMAQPTPDSARSITAIRLVEPVRIDGKLTETVWNRPGETRFVQRAPDEGKPSSQRTEAWIAYDDVALYVAVKLYDAQPDSIIGRLARRDQDSESDEVGIGIDAAHDRRNAVYFIVNPVGAVKDGTFSNDTQTDDSWDGVWDVATSREPWGWSAEFRIPFSQLRFSKSDHYVWGIEIYRGIKRRNEESYLVLHPRTDRVRVSRWIQLAGIEQIQPPSRIELLPYATATGKFIQQPAVDAFNTNRSDPFKNQRRYPMNVGADAKVGLTGDITLDLSLNPDFAQVEVDPAVVNLTAYETYYQEKRPFFIEGSTILNFGRGGAALLQDFDWSDPSFFYSRRIGRAPQGSVSHEGFVDLPDRTTILGAAKVSGKITNTWSFAALGAVTDREYGDVDSAGVRFRDEIEPLTLYGVVRTLKEFNDARQAVGFLGTVVERNVRDSQMKQLLNDRALSLGVDGWSFLDEKKVWVLTGWAGASSVAGSKERITNLQFSPQHYFQRPDAGYLGVDSSATSLSGWASRIWLDKVTGNWIFDAALGAISPGFETNDAGYLTHADFINGHLYFGYEWYEPEGIIRSKGLTGAYLREYDFGGTMIGEGLRLFVWAQHLNYWTANLTLAYNGESFDDQHARGGPLMKSLRSRSLVFSLSSDSREPFYGTATMTAGRGESGGWLYTEELAFNWKASHNFTTSLTLDYARTHGAAQYIDAVTDPYATSTYGTRYIFGVIDQKQLSTTLRMNWTFTPRMSLQLYLQPLLSTGAYSRIGELAQPGTFDFNRYGDGASRISLSDGVYSVTPDGPGGRIPAFSISDPDFNFKSVRANVVFRWEYLPGSTLYFVWTNEKMDNENRGDFSFDRDVRRLMRMTPDNVYSLKLTYWINP
ncbi:MAG TPA: DUF5916 domain-containing protein [Bacteroidota bacterium]|nr:DUF5916 domain-containing protein [Bacteroidota bacterium]